MDLSPSVIYVFSLAAIMTQTGCSDKAAMQDASAPVATHTPAATSTFVAPGPFEPIVQTSDSGLRVSWLRYGATLMEVHLPDGTPVLAHLQTPEDYEGDHPYVGSLVGRVANRISGASFTIDGTAYDVIANEGENTLHAGPEGFEQVVWDVELEGEELVFRHTSPAGHEGYPGNLDVTLRSTLTDTDLKLKLIAITDAPTPVNLTQHGYWNPSGRFNAPIDTLTLQTPADRYTAVDDALIPTGESPPVEGTPYDFRTARPIGPDFVDINLLVPGDGVREMATFSDGLTQLTVLSDYPGLQVFTGEALDGVDGLLSRGALALEPQYPPDAINQTAQGEDTVLRPGEVYRHTIIYRFGGPGIAANEE